MDDKPYVTDWIRAKMSPLGENVTNRVKVGTRTVQKRKGMFNSEMVDVEEDIFEQQTSWIPTGKFSETQIDAADLSTRIEETLNDYWSRGYELVQIMDYIEGRYNWKTDSGRANHAVVEAGMWSYAYGYGYSLTDGVVMVFRKRVEIRSD